MKMNAPADWASPITIEGGMEYHPDDNDQVEVKNADHVAILRQHGYTDPPAEPTAPYKRPKCVAAPVADEDDEFDGMTKGELVEWLEKNDVEIPAKPKLAQLQELARAKAAEDDE